jgi:hypothetical protein
VPAKVSTLPALAMQENKNSPVITAENRLIIQTPWVIKNQNSMVTSSESLPKKDFANQNLNLS